MKLVVIESPYAGDVERNRTYLNRCIRDCIDRGESPYASHKMLVDSLDDTDPGERVAGINAGLAWAPMCDMVVCYADYGFSRGMALAMYEHGKSGRGFQIREIGVNPE